MWWIIGFIVIIVGLFGWSQLMQSSDPNIVARSGLHWHPQLTIYVKGEHVEIPADIGVGPQYIGKPTHGDGGMAMTAIHTHEDMPVIHLEFSGVVRKEDIMLGRFFEIWGKDMPSFGENMRMTINGSENSEFEKYIMRDKDIIVLQYD